jgi:hypothetical protein
MSEEESIRRTALDYFEGWYEADEDRVARALHPELAKRWAEQDGGRTLGRVLSKQMMLEFVRQGGGLEDRTQDPIDVSVVDVHRDIASVVVRSAQYREYLHLVKTSDGWRIVQTFWQFTESPS